MNTTTTQAAMTLADLRNRWIGRKLHATTTPKANYGHGSLDPQNAIESINFDSEFQQFAAWNGAHHRANSAEALDRLLQSLAVR